MDAVNAAGSGAPKGAAGEGEEQEEESSSSSSVLQAGAALEKLSVEDAPCAEDDELVLFREQWQRELQGTPSLQDSPNKSALEQSSKLSSSNPQADDMRDGEELSLFWQQWHRELDGAPSPQRQATPKLEPEETLTDEEQARRLFLAGVELERCGRVFEAVRHYRRAVQLQPDVEARLYERPEPPDAQEVATSAEEALPERASYSDSEDSENDVAGCEDLAARLQRRVARRGRLLEPAYPPMGTHISHLPYEVLVAVAGWAVGAELDARALERLAAASRGFYLVAREHSLWKDICVRTWGCECGTPRAHGFADWREMYILRPRLQLHGCYISKTTYLRPGEESYPEYSYRPWHLIDYYRYLRFFSDGVVLMWTTAEEPTSAVAQLRHRTPRVGLGILVGQYRLMGNTVAIVIKKDPPGARAPAASRFRARRRDSHDAIAAAADTAFHVELELVSSRSRRNWQLRWRRYLASRRGALPVEFELTPARYPAFAFSGVRSYTAQPAAPPPTPAH